MNPGFLTRRDHTVNVLQRTTFPFKVRACDSAKIRFRDYFGDDEEGWNDMADIVIGQEVVTLNIYKPNSTEKVTKTLSSPGIIHCNYYLKFWLRWDLGRIMFGNHNLDTALIDEPDPYGPRKVKSLTLTNDKSNIMVEYQFARFAGNHTFSKTILSLNKN